MTSLIQQLGSLVKGILTGFDRNARLSALNSVESTASSFVLKLAASN